MNMVANRPGTALTPVAAGPAFEPREAGVETGSDFSVGFVLGLIGRWKILILAWIAVIMVGVFMLTTSLKPLYRADATVLLDTRLEHVSDVKSVVSGPLTTPDPAVARSEVKILQSSLIAERVIDRLNLTDNPDFQLRPGALSTLLRLIGLSSGTRPVSAAVARQRMLDEYARRLSVFNDGRSFTFSVAFEAGDPVLAAQVANLHVELYLADQRALKQNAGQRASGTLATELTRLRAELDAKQAQILQLRASDDLITSRGSTITAQQLADVNGQLVIAQASSADKAARLAQARNGGADAQTTVLNSNLVQKLRESQAEAQASLADLSSRFGANYPPVQATRARAADLSARIAAETGRIVRSLQDDAAIAKRQEQALAAQLNELRQQAIAQDRSSARLTQLEQEARSTQTVYDGLFSRQREIEGQNGSEAADARLVSPAAVPEKPFFPNPPLFLALAFVMSSVSGVGVAWALDKRGSGFNVPEDLEAELPIPPMERVPMVSRSVLHGHPMADLVVDEPRSEFAEAIRSLRADVLVANGGQAPRTIAITSSLPKEGKTTLALALARSMASFGLQVLLVDADLRHPQVAANARVSARTPGLLAVLQGRATLGDAVMDDAVLNLSLLVPEAATPAVQDLLAGPRLPALLDQAQRSFDVVIVDTPPAGAVSDALLIARHMDCNLLVVRWRSTPAAIVQAIARRFDTRGLRLSGTVLNAVNEKAVARSSPERARMRRSVQEYYGA